jgi:phenylalanyl-tRNA synthetase alpha chain
VSVDSSVGDIQSLVDEALIEIGSAESSRDIERARVRLLGKKGALTEQLKRIGSLPAQERRAFGQAVNDAKQLLAEKISERRVQLDRREQDAVLTSGWVDVSLAGRRAGTGCLHPVSRTIRRIHDIFGRLGFDVAEGPEIEDDYHNFEALNIPPNHPARAMHDTFYVEPDVVLRTHTSPVQIRYLKSHPPPIQVIAPGRVYRCDSDVTHTPMFHQLEGLVVDTDIAFSDLKGMLIHFVREFFEHELPVRFRPSYFPFTEPSAEVDMRCGFCAGAGCRVCQQTGWLEILGCGMVHPTVFRQVGINNDEYTGYAFGVGIERLTMLRYGVDDLRLFFDNELAFLTQFR